MDKLKEQLCNNIWSAFEDYFRHADSDDVYENISEQFVDRLASDSIKSKRALRELFCKSQGWNENLQAIVINGTKTHNPNYTLVHDLANSILYPAKLDADCDKLNLIDRTICFFSRPNDKNDSYINAIETLAPQAYAPRKKRSRIFKAICDSLGVTDLNAGSSFQHLFAQFADELSTKKIDFKLFMSIHPAHFLTMSNPKRDDRGSTLTSCHSFNVLNCDYNCGCFGYARDDVTFIVFTAFNPDNPETLNNRKTTRQLFMYKPFNGLLLQSRLYNTHGGTCGAQAESNFIAIWFSVNFPNLRAFLTSGRPKNTVATNMVFTSLVVMVLAVIAIGFTRTLTPKFLSGKTTLTTSRLSRLELMVFALRVPANFLQSFCATIAITMVANSVRSVRITALKHGTFSIATASSFTSAKVVWTNIIAFVNTAKSISTKAK